MQPGQEVTDDWSGVNLPFFDCHNTPEKPFWEKRSHFLSWAVFVNNRFSVAKPRSIHNLLIMN
ncbi:MAG TPA: hypothetical protein V6D50_03050 [Chroococcales cyanobacterium]|jgi:hypothetical protein